MFEIKAGAFYLAVTQLAEVSSWISATTNAAKNEKDTLFHEERALDVPDITFLRGRLERLRDHLDNLEARITLIAVLEAQDSIRYSGVTWGQAKIRFDEISNTLRRELSSAKLLSLEAKEQSYFSPMAPLFGEDFQTKFTSGGAFELDEAAKCLAVGRPTASIFHLMRLMEIGVRAVARCLDIPDPIQPADRSWGAVLQRVRDGIDAKWSTVAACLVGDGEIFDSLYASLDAVKNPWRNATMHPANKYTHDEAEHVFAAVRGFMMRLASRCDENGDPKA